MDVVEREMTAVRVAAWGGVLGPVVFATLVIVGGAATDGYSHVTQKISELGAVGAQYATLQNVNFLILGVSIVGFAWALAKRIGPPVLGPVLVGLFGIVAVLHAFVNCDVGCKGQTGEGLLHNVTGVIGFVAMISGMAILARRWRTDAEWKPYVPFTLSAATVAIVGLVVFVFTQANDIQTFAGVAQRVFAGAFLIWIAVTAARLLRR